MKHIRGIVSSRLGTLSFRTAGVLLPLAVALAASSCTPHGGSEPGAPPPPDDAHSTAPPPMHGAPSPGKPSAPVKVSAEIQDRRALVTVTVARDARDIEVSVRGLDGITIVTPVTPLRAASALAGEKIVVGVAFAGATPGGTLVVQVQGVFAGRPLGAVRTFSIGQPPAPKDPPRTDASGRPVVVLPAN